MRTSKQGVAFIAGFEGFVGHPYRDAIGVLTVGFGHTGPDVESIGTITRQQGLELLAKDLPRYEAPVNALGLKLNQHQFDALVSAVYNLGPGVLGRGRSLGDALRSGNLRAAADALLLYDKAGGRALPGLTRRRQEERALFLKPLLSDRREVAQWRRELRLTRVRIAKMRALARSLRKRIKEAS